MYHIKTYSKKDYRKYYPSRKEAFFDIADEAALDSRVAYKKVPLKALASALSLIKIVKKEIKTIDVPALIIHSIKDNTIKPESSRFIYDNLGTSPGKKTIVYLKNSGHVITEDFDQKTVFAEISNFIRKIS